MDARRPRALIVLHKLLIGTAAVFGGFLSIWSIVQYTRTGSLRSIAVAVASGLVAVALAMYWRTIDRRYGGL